MPVPVRAQPLSTGLRRFLIALLISFGPGALSLSAASTQELQHVLTTQVEENATISGRVADQRTGRLLRDIEVRLMRGSKVISTCIVDAQGEFMLSFPRKRWSLQKYSLELTYLGMYLDEYLVHVMTDRILLLTNCDDHAYPVPFVEPEPKEEDEFFKGGLVGVTIYNNPTPLHSYIDQNTMMEQMLLGR